MHIKISNAQKFTNPTNSHFFFKSTQKLSPLQRTRTNERRTEIVPSRDGRRKVLEFSRAAITHPSRSVLFYLERIPKSIPGAAPPPSPTHPLTRKPPPALAGCVCASEDVPEWCLPPRNCLSGSRDGWTRFMPGLCSDSDRGGCLMWVWCFGVMINKRPISV